MAQSQTAHRQRPVTRPAAPAPRSRNRSAWYVGAAIAATVVIVVTLVLIKMSGGSSPASTRRQSQQTAPASVVEAATGVPGATVDRVGIPSGVSLPDALPAAAPLTLPAAGSGSLPGIVYVGADYCPYCAAERWALVAALSRFGTFSDLKITTSASGDVYPSTYTFSFSGSHYSSPYVAFTAVELYGNEPGADGHYPTLETPTPTVQRLLSTYDVPPYTSSAGGIPFLDIANRYLVISSQFSPALLAGLDAGQIAARLADPATAVSQAVVGSANALTAAVCRSTGGQPVAVCDAAGVTAAGAKLP